MTVVWPEQAIDTDSFLKGAITDYGPSMVQWMRNRQPRYKGGARIEMERPSPSYIIDVCCIKRFLLASLSGSNQQRSTGAPPSCQSPTCRRRNTFETPTFITQQDKTSSERCQMDPRRSAVVDWVKQRRVHTVEWDRFQLRNHNAGWSVCGYHRVHAKARYHRHTIPLFELPDIRMARNGSCQPIRTAL